MKIYIWPKTYLGKIASLLSLVFIFLLALTGVYVPDHFSGMLGLVAASIGIVALKNKDNSLFVYISLLVGIYVITCCLAAII